MPINITRSHTRWKNSLLIVNKVKNGGMGACHQKHFLSQCPLKQGFPTFFLRGPHSDLGYRQRATSQWHSQCHTSKGSKSGCGQGAKEYGPWRATMELTRGRVPFPTVMVRVEVLSDTKQERKMTIRGQTPPRKFV